jgi:tetratricopeptide (TPR) repeat protein
MTVDPPITSYSERLGSLGSAIDDEIRSIITRECDAAVEAFKKSSAPAIPHTWQKKPTESKIEEGLLILQNRSDPSAFDALIDHHPEVVCDLRILRAMDSTLRARVIGHVNQSDLIALFSRACRSNDKQILRMVHAEWNSRLLNAIDEEGELPIIKLIRTGDAQAVEEWLEKGADVMANPIAGTSALHEAVESGKSAMVELLLSHFPSDKSRDLLLGKAPGSVSVMDMQTTEEVRQILDAHWLLVLSVEGNTFYKEGRFPEAVDRYLEAILLCDSLAYNSSKTENLVKLEYNCARSLFRLGKFVDSVAHCSRCMELDPSYLNALSQRAQALIELADFTAAKKDYETLIEYYSARPGTDVRQINEFRLKVFELEQIIKTDHYTVLEIEKFSDEQAVKSAYRKLARKFHPDKVMGESDDFRARSRNQFSRIQTAYEVLTGQTREEYDLNLKIIAGTEAVRQTLLRRRSSMGATLRSSFDPSCSPPVSPSRAATAEDRKVKMRQFLGSSDVTSRSFDVLFRN